MPLPDLSVLHGQGSDTNNSFVCSICSYWMLSRSYRSQDDSLGKYKKVCSTLTWNANQDTCMPQVHSIRITNTQIVIHIMDSAFGNKFNMLGFQTSQGWCVLFQGYGLMSPCSISWKGIINFYLALKVKVVASPIQWFVWIRESKYFKIYYIAAFPV